MASLTVLFPMARTVIILALALLAFDVRAQVRYAVGKQLPGPLRVYSVSPSGEIAQIQEPSPSSFGAELLLDWGGRMVVIRAQGRVHVYRVAHDRVLTLASRSSSEVGSSFQQSLALSQDGRVVLGLRYTASPEHFEFCTFFVNNRLQLRSTGCPLEADSLGGIGSWTISDRGQYTAIVNLAPNYAILSVSASGEIVDTGRRVTTPWTHTRQFDTSSDGRWLLIGQNSPPGLALYEVESSGEVALHDTFTHTSLTAVWTNRLFPDLSAVAVADGNGPMTISLNASMEFGEIIDQETLGSGSNAIAVSHDGQMLLADAQAPGFVFPIYSYSLSPGGQMTSTGHSLPRSDFQADLRFIPDPTPVSLAGDANVDGVVDAADIVFLVNEAMPDDKPILLPPNFANADLDQDVDVDQDDLEALVAMLVGEMP